MFAHVYFIYIAHVITAVALAKVLHTDTNYTVKGLKILIQSNNKREEKAFLCEFVHLSNNTGPACLSLHHRCVCVCVYHLHFFLHLLISDIFPFAALPHILTALRGDTLRADSKDFKQLDCVSGVLCQSN